MTDIQTVRDTLLVSAKQGVTGNGLPEPSGAEAALRCIAGQIDRTVLARRIRVSLADTSLIELDVENRRLLRCVEILARGSSIDIPETGVDGGLKPDDDAEIAQYLQAKFAASAINGIQTIDLPDARTSTSTGISPSAILHYANVEVPRGDAVDLETRVAEFITDFAPDAVAALVISGDEIVAIHGSDDALDRIVDWAWSMFGNPEGRPSPLLDTMRVGGFCSLHCSGSSAHHALVIKDTNAIGVVVSDGADAMVRLRDWVAFSGGPDGQSKCEARL